MTGTRPTPSRIDKERPKLRDRGRPSNTPGTGKSTIHGRKPKPPMAALTDEEVLFAEAYICHFNGTKAYLDVHPDVAVSTARSEGSRMLHRPNIAQYIKGIVAEEVRRLKATSQRVLEEASALAFSSLADVFDAKGLIVPPSKLPRSINVAVKKIKRQEILGADADGPKVLLGHTVEVEMHDKLGPLKLLGQHLGLFKERVEVSGKGLAELLKEARERSVSAG